MALPTPEESAKALQDYMARAHEEKLDAIEAVEKKKNAEIGALREELDKLRASRGTSSIELASSSLDTREMSDKLLAYQTFMTEYIVNAQEEKIRAVKAAEAAIKKKCEERLLLGDTSTSPTPVVLTPTKETVAETKLYTDRSAKVAAAAQAGKSRWGDAEVTKVRQSTLLNGSVQNQPSQPQSQEPIIEVSPQIIAADHGLKRKGDLTLAERVMLGSQVVKLGNSDTPPEGITADHSPLYHKRNMIVAAAGKAGKSRWGEMEIDKVNKLLKESPAFAIVDSSVLEADKGLRSVGAVGGPSLAERVNLGAQILSKN